MYANSFQIKLGMLDLIQVKDIKGFIPTPINIISGIAFHIKKRGL